MQCDDLDVEISRPLNELDNSLNDLGMLATRTKSREEYLSEIQNKKYLNMLTINTRYVSNVSIGYKVRPTAPHVRYKPYKLHKQRHRTKSENSDVNTNECTSFVKNIIDDCVDKSVEELNQLKKAKSLESIVSEGGDQNVDLKNMKVEVETVSTCIQNLKVDE
ncbi:unnamed protein product [Brassicogethes aeneus]|uniref:Uncharacterized protein n=1 Tax=Brassicogethes aeneus TaxID=1431903 RepID=A0A9P0BHH9_BRAAE|nr:unnamed protein product [Brassicogethes aeneus]